jgi:bifunctional enzyme CysN/CysC
MSQNASAKSAAKPITRTRFKTAAPQMDIPALPPAAANDAPIATPLASPQSLLRFITCGSVDDGKSTLIGRLLFEANAVFADQLDTLDRDSQKFGTANGARDYALLVDGLSAEREQGITIDVAYRYFATPQRSFIVADTPGHEQYTRNMATGASTADLAIILIDARKGVLGQTRRHSFIASVLGIRHAVVAVNKMDAVGYDQSVFETIIQDYRALAGQLGFDKITFIPVSAREGDNIAERSARMPWYDGQALLGHLETVAIALPGDQPFRFCVQWVNRPDPDFRGYAGLVASGSILPGAKVRVLPSGQTSSITRLVTADGDLAQAQSGQTPTLCLGDDIDLSRGDVVVSIDDTIRAAARLRARLLWMDEAALLEGNSYLLRLGSASTNASVSNLHYAIGIKDLGPAAATALAMNGIGFVSLTLDRPVVFTNYVQNRTLGSFILIDRLTHATVALGLIDQGADTKALADPLAQREEQPAKPGRAFQKLQQWMHIEGEKPSRSLAKAITWRVLGSLDTFLLSLLFTQSAKLAAAISATEIVTKIVLYYAHERVWARSRFGLSQTPSDAANSTAGAGI